MFVSLNQTAPFQANAGLTQNVTVNDTGTLSNVANNSALPNGSTTDYSGWLILAAIVAVLYFFIWR